MTVTSCVTRCWCFFTCKSLAPPTLKLEQSENNRIQKSSTTSQTWAQLFLIGNVNEIRPLVSVDSAVHRNTTLGVAMGPRRWVTDQLLAKAGVIWAVRDRVPLCQDPQTGFALLRESLDVSRINHIPRVHCHTILHEEEAAKTF